MKATDEKVEILSGVRDENGERLEPEEQPARESAITTIDVNLGHEPTGGTRVATKPIAINDDTTALDLATRHMRRCELCSEFRRGDWLALKKRLSDPSNHDGVNFLNAIRGYLLGNADTLTELRTVDHDVERMLDVLGICAAVTEEDKEISIAIPDGTCSRFTPRDQQARKTASTVYDAVLLAASK